MSYYLNGQLVQGEMGKGFNSLSAPPRFRHRSSTLFPDNTFRPYFHWPWSHQNRQAMMDNTFQSRAGLLHIGICLPKLCHALKAGLLRLSCQDLVRGRVTSSLTAVAKTGLQNDLYRSYSNNKYNNKILFCFSLSSQSKRNCN